MLRAIVLTLSLALCCVPLAGDRWCETTGRRASSRASSRTTSSARQSLSRFRTSAEHAQPKALLPDVLHVRSQSGYERAALKLGLLLPDKGNRLLEAAEVRRGAELAVDEARRAGQRVKLIVRTDGGNWGSGVRAITALAFTDNSDVLMGGVDSATAHLIEQIAMKARVAFITPWAQDYTLTRIGIPFMFLIAPDDRQQAPALVRRVFSGRNANVGVLCGEDRSNRLAAYSFIRFAAKSGHPIPNERVWLTPDGAPTNAGVLGRVNLSPAHPVEPLEQVLREAATAHIGNLVLFGSLDLQNRTLTAMHATRSGFRFATPMEAARLDAGFRKRFAARYHAEATLPAAYGFDSVMVAVRAARTVPNPDNHQALRDAIARLHTVGVTGPIRFDKRGNRVTADSGRK